MASEWLTLAGHVTPKLIHVPARCKHTHQPAIMPRVRHITDRGSRHLLSSAVGVAPRLRT